MITRQMFIAVDEGIQIANTDTPIQDANTYYRDTTYIVIGTMVNSVANSGTYTVPASSTWAAFIGDVYGVSALPVLSITNSAVWNLTSDFVGVSPDISGIFCFQLDTSLSSLAVDMNNSTSTTYTLEIINYNNGIGQLICSNPINILNISVGP